MKWAKIHIIFALAFLFTGTALPSLAEENGTYTMDSVASKHQDALLAAKYFSFQSTITFIRNEQGATATEKAIEIKGTSNIDGWSHVVVRATGTLQEESGVVIEYYIKDDIPLRMVSVTDRRFPAAADTSEGWERADLETYHREASLNPLYMFAPLIGNKTELLEKPGESTSASGGAAVCRLFRTADNSGDNAGALTEFCIDAGNGLILGYRHIGDFMPAAVKSADASSKAIAAIQTVLQPSEKALDLQIPERVQTLFDEETKKADKQ